LFRAETAATPRNHAFGAILDFYAGLTRAISTLLSRRVRVRQHCQARAGSRIQNLSETRGSSVHNIFVTGGTGFMGRNLMVELMRRAHTVRTLARPGSEGKLP